MKPTRLTTSAALFYACESNEDPVPFAWYERVLDLFGQLQLSPILFTAAGGQFEFDDCYHLADGEGLEFRWQDPVPIKRCRSALVEALQQGMIYYLGLDTPRSGGRNRSDCHAQLSASSVGGNLFIGLDEELESDPATLLRRACELARGLFDVRYGFAYKMPLADEPDCYAVGFRSSTWPEVREWIRNRHGERPKTADQLWGDELHGKRRHLMGLFRGVYPANVLSDQHVQAAGLRSSGIGKLSELDGSRWLWEVAEAEIPVAKEMLRARRLLVPKPKSQTPLIQADRDRHGPNAVQHGNLLRKRIRGFGSG